MRVWSFISLSSLYILLPIDSVPPVFYRCNTKSKWHNTLIDTPWSPLLVSVTSNIAYCSDRPLIARPNHQHKTCRYLHINQLKNPFQINIILCLYSMYSSVSCRPNALLRRGWSCVDLVLPKLFPRINNVFELQQNRKRKVTQYGCLLKGNFWGSI